MNCNHCFCIPFEHGVMRIKIKSDYQCCQCGKAKYGLSKKDKEKIKKIKKELQGYVKGR